jgi:type IV pilus assembly protein PilF
VTTVTGGPKPATTQQKLTAYLDLARGYLEKRDYTNARRPLKEALRVDDSSAEAHVLMASVYIGEGDTKLAEQEYKDAIRHEPKNAMAQNNYGTFLFAAGQYKDAAKHLKIAADDPSYGRRGQAYENLGLTQLKLKQPDAAEQSFLRALMLNVDQPRSDFELAELYFTAGDFGRARQYFDAFNKLAKPTASSLWLGVRLSRVLGDQDGLSSYALALKNLFPTSPEYRLYQDRNW